MSVIGGPNNNTSGLIFEYDMGNVLKSFIGGPVTNSQWNGGSEVSPWTVGGTNTDVTGSSEAGPSLGKTWKFVKSGTSNQWNGWESTYGGIWTGSAGDVWTTSYWYKTSSPAGLTGFGIGSFYTSDWSRAYNTTILEDRSSIIADGQWHFNYTVVRFNEAYTNAIIADGPSWNYSTSAGTLYINGLQWSKTPYASPFAQGTRSSTQSIKDLTNRNQITVSGLTYSYDGSSFSFNSANSSNISVPLSTAFNKLEGTINLWIYPTSYNGGNGYFVNRTDSTPNAVDWLWIGPYSGTFYFRLGDGTTCCNNDLTISNFYSVVPLNAWYNMCFTWKSGGTSAIYINGVLYTSRSISTIPNTSPASNGTFGLGHSNAATYFDGKMPLAQIYNRQLSSEEVLQNFISLRGRYGI